MTKQNNQTVSWESIVIRYAKEIDKLTNELRTLRREGLG